MKTLQVLSDVPDAESIDLQMEPVTDNLVSQNNSREQQIVLGGLSVPCSDQQSLCSQQFTDMHVTAC